MMAAMPDLQEVLALAVVLAVVITALWRMWRRRSRSRDACGDCSSSGAGKTPKEAPIRFYRRRPGTDADRK